MRVTFGLFMMALFGGCAQQAGPVVSKPVVSNASDITPERALALDCQRGSRTSCDAIARMLGGPSQSQPAPSPAVQEHRQTAPQPQTAAAPHARPARSVLSADAVLAQRLVRTHRYEAHEQRSSGAITGCGMLFTVGVRDDIYRNGGVIMVAGGLEVMSLRPGNIIWTVKLVPTDVIWDDAVGDGRTVVFDPPYGWLSVGSFSSAGQDATRFRCEGGGFCAAGQQGLTSAVAGLLNSPTITLGMRRSGGQLDIQGTVQGGQTSPFEQERFGRCIRGLLDQVPADPAPTSQLPRT